MQPCRAVLEMTPAVQDNLGKLLRMLSSDKPGEVVAAASAIMRTLATEGLDIHNLADALCQPVRRAEVKAQSAAASADDTDWHSVACECEAHGAALTVREQKFVSHGVVDVAHEAERTATGVAADHSQ
jgi:hypothetical protein